ncbi:hypothetical protein [Prevotella pallens]|jgi:hypothetical protein|uniref:hypothetical protein n=1 Tax=Prevotella pallens TaxID=60133 RepID=UPI001CB4A22F|nr:hypothetical protein [Prevotella pallens]MBF1517832.1 hypothetical protein [Prevotella pallens]
MIVYINLFIALAFSFVCLGLSKIITEYIKLNKRIDNLFANQRMMYKYQLFSLLANMRNLKTLAIIQEEYEIANSIQENIKGIEEVLKEYEQRNNI